MISDLQIEEAKRGVKYSLPEVHHEHNDCIRIAYEWLDAQIKTKGRTNRHNPLKYYIQNWAGRYVSRSDVDVAAFLHPGIYGSYPNFNIRSRLTEPSTDRLRDISEAGKQRQYHEQHDPSIYAIHES